MLDLSKLKEVQQRIEAMSKEASPEELEKLQEVAADFRASCEEIKGDILELQAEAHELEATRLRNKKAIETSPFVHIYMKNPWMKAYYG